jgi:5'-phosphate synthase pdxT subunit
MKIGVLALQGAFEEHIKMLSQLGVCGVEIRNKSDLQQSFDGLIIPGGESTVISKLLRELDMYEILVSIIKENNLPVFGTCAGLILMSENANDNKVQPLRLMSFTAKRNAYGRQLGSFAVNAEFKGIGNIPMVFIRAPYISEASDKVEILATVNDRIVAARQGKFLATAFHPELTNDLSVHKYFINMISAN